MGKITHFHGSHETKPSDINIAITSSSKRTSRFSRNPKMRILTGNARHTSSIKVKTSALLPCQFTSPKLQVYTVLFEAASDLHSK